MKWNYTLPDVSCAACVSRVEKALSRIPGIESVQVNLLTKELRIEGDPGAVTEEQIEEKLRAIGYPGIRKSETRDTVLH